jgi:uncharacterized membrane protein YgdD (TMEM256/DUF423 family)
VLLGAFGAHALKARLTPELAAVWQTAVQYHFWHAIALLAVGLAAVHLESGWVRAAGWLFLVGVALFSGSLYALVLGAPRAMGRVTPLGGAAFLCGWLAFAFGVARA